MYGLCWHYTSEFVSHMVWLIPNMSLLYRLYSWKHQACWYWNIFNQRTSRGVCEQPMGNCVWWLMEYFWCKSCLQTAWLLRHRWAEENSDNSHNYQDHCYHCCFQVQLPTVVLSTAKELFPSSWMMSDVLIQKADWLTVPTLPLITVYTLKMLLLAAQQVKG